MKHQTIYFTLFFKFFALIKLKYLTDILKIPIKPLKTFLINVKMNTRVNVFQNHGDWEYFI